MEIVGKGESYYLVHEKRKGTDMEFLYFHPYPELGSFTPHTLFDV